MKIETKRPIIKKKKVSGESIVKMKTEITELLGIEYPIIQGGMAWVAEYHLAAAVSEAGGLGIIGAASAPPEWVRDQIQKAKKMTDKPFGITFTSASFHICIYFSGEPAPVVTTFTFSSTITFAISSAYGLISIMLTPKGLSVIFFAFCI